jgi:hypothetical protein
VAFLATPLPMAMRAGSCAWVDQIHVEGGRESVCARAVHAEWHVRDRSGWTSEGPYRLVLTTRAVYAERHVGDTGACAQTWCTALYTRDRVVRGYPTVPYHEKWDDFGNDLA